MPQIYPLCLYFFHLPWSHRGPVAIFSHLSYSCSLLTLLPASTTAPTVFVPPAARGVILGYKLDCVSPILKIFPWLPIMLIKHSYSCSRHSRPHGTWLLPLQRHHISLPCSVYPTNLLSGLQTYCPTSPSYHSPSEFPWPRTFISQVFPRLGSTHHWVSGQISPPQ